MPHAFISYVRENREQVTKLARDLNARGIDTWTDAEIVPGQRWKRTIRNAIRDGAAFLACFSPELVGRSSSYMNEEITLAIEMCRLMPHDRSWFIPVLLGKCEVPDRDIGGGETLHDIQRVALYDDWDRGVDLIVSALTSSLSVHLDEQLSDEPPLPKMRAPPTYEQIKAWESVWKQLFKLKIAGDAVITTLTPSTLAEYAKRLQKAVDRIGETAFFFDKDDFDQLNELLQVSLHLRLGKERLQDIRTEMTRMQARQLEREISRALDKRLTNRRIKRQIEENVENHKKLCKAISRIHQRYSKRMTQHKAG